MNNHLGTFLAVCREIKGLSLRDAAERTGICYNVLSRMERGENRPSFDAVAKLAKLYGLRLERLAKEARKDTQWPSINPVSPKLRFQKGWK